MRFVRVCFIPWSPVMTLFVVVAIDPEDGPYVYSDSTCSGEAECSASEARHETGQAVLVKPIELNLGAF